MTNTSPTTTNPEMDALLRDATNGDMTAVRKLFEKHRDRLRKMIAMRLDRRLSPRLDPSDIVQETLADAARKLPGYLRDRPLPFYPWLYRLAAERVVRTHREHVKSSVRGIRREQRIDGPLRDTANATLLIDRLTANDTTPGRCAACAERQRIVATAMSRIDEADREVLGLRYVDQLAFDEIAAVLGIGLSAANMRHLRALRRLRDMLKELGMELSASP